MQITINNLDLSYSIDTYGMFTGDSSYDSEIEHYGDTYGLTDDERYSINFDYDHPAIVKDLATASVEILESEIVESDGIVTSIELVTDGTRSPQFYNYTTDSYKAIWDVNETMLASLIDGNHSSEFKQFLRDSAWGDDLETDSDDYVVAMLDYWLPTVLSEDDYNMALWERETEIYMEHMQLDDESQTLINTKEEVQL